MKKFKNLCGGVLTASLMLGGGIVSPTFADDVIYVNGSGGTNSNAATNATSSANILGYQTANPEGYAVNVTWGDMSFVYDKGSFNTSTGELSRATTNTNFEGVEAGITDGTINRWYGFDGDNNRVVVTNLSTGGVTLGANAVKSVDETSGSETFNLYFPADYRDASHGLADAGSVYTVHHSAGTSPTMTDTSMYVTGNGTDHPSLSGITLTAHPRENDGTLTASPLTSNHKFDFYLNITGEPSASFSDDSNNLGVIGNITLTFNKTV